MATGSMVPFGFSAQFPFGVGTEEGYADQYSIAYSRKPDQGQPGNPFHTPSRRRNLLSCLSAEPCRPRRESSGSSSTLLNPRSITCPKLSNQSIELFESSMYPP